jgi:hypothetical protein
MAVRASALFTFMILAGAQFSGVAQGQDAKSILQPATASMGADKRRNPVGASARISHQSRRSDDHCLLT